jgi:hypothetical protein
MIQQVAGSQRWYQGTPAPNQCPGGFALNGTLINCLKDRGHTGECEHRSQLGSATWGAASATIGSAGGNEVSEVKTCGELVGQYGAAFTCALDKGHEGDHGPIRERIWAKPEWYIHVLRDLSATFESRMEAAATNGLDKYTRGANMQSRENLKYAADYIEHTTRESK